MFHQISEFDIKKIIKMKLLQKCLPPYLILIRVLFQRLVVVMFVTFATTFSLHWAGVS